MLLGSCCYGSFDILFMQLVHRELITIIAYAMKLLLQQTTQHVDTVDKLSSLYYNLTKRWVVFSLCLFA